MKNIKALYPLITGICYLCWWWGFVFFLPFGNVLTDYPSLINNPAWIPVNLFEVVGIIFFMLFFKNVIKDYYKDTIIDEFMIISMFIGFFCFCGVAFYETFLWPVLALHAPDILHIVHGPIYTSPLFVIPTIIAILFFLAGNVYMGIRLIKAYRVVSIVYCIGMVIFLFGYLAGSVRYIAQATGLSLFSIAFILIGVSMFRGKKES